MEVGSSTSTLSVEVLGSDSSDYTYDANGNMTNLGDMYFTWDQKNRLVRVTGTPEGTVDYTYDALGRRVSKEVVNGVTTQYLYDGLNLIAELDGNGDALAWYVYTLNVDEPLARVASNGDVHYYHADILGSIVALTDEDGAVVTQYNYSPFGVTEAISEGVVQPFRFTGREWDAETGMYFYRARYYSPTLARFTSEDPIRFESGDVNWYRYVGNDPVNKKDPLGLFPNQYPDPFGPNPHPPGDTSFCADNIDCSFYYVMAKALCHTSMITEGWRSGHTPSNQRSAPERYNTCLEDAEDSYKKCTAKTR